MSLKKIARNPRFIIWILFIIISIALIAPNPNPRGMEVTLSRVNGIESGDIIYFVNSEPAFPAHFERTYAEIVVIETNRGTRFVSPNGTLGISAERPENSNLKFGLDLKGGVRAVLQPETSDNATLEQVISTLQTRINVYGLREAVFRSLYVGDSGFVEVSIAGGTSEELKSLLENQGKFEAKIPFVIRVGDGKAVLKLDKSYDLLAENSSITVGGVRVSEGGIFELAGTKFTLNDVERNFVNLTAVPFDGSDVITVFFDPQRSRIEPINDGFNWVFGVQISSDAAQRFAYVTQNIDVLPNGYLAAPIEFYLDDNFIDSLRISSSLKGRTETEVSISGFAPTMEEAQNEQRRLQSILRSGALPTKVEIVQLDTLSPTLGEGFLKNAALAGLAAIIGVLVIVSLRYRRPKFVIPLVIISMSEIIITLGLLSPFWTIDLAAIAGIIAAVGTGVDSEIIVLDRALRKEDDRTEGIKEKLKKAFFVIFGSAGTIIAAMIPLMIIGFGVLRGFAIVTIIGVLVGVFITRPVYGVIVEHMKKD